MLESLSMHRDSERWRRIRTYFKRVPDYLFCRALAENVEAGVVSGSQALTLVAVREKRVAENSQAVAERLDQFSIDVDGRRRRLLNMSLNEILQLPDKVLKDVVEFYLKHPFAHGRTFRSKLIPRVLRTYFLGALFGHAKNRRLEVDFVSCFELLRLL